MCCHLCLPAVVRGWFSKNGSGLEMRVNFRHLVPIGVFMLLHGGSLSLGSFSPLLVPHDALGSIIFFLLARDIAKSAWSVRSVILFLKHQACWASPGHGPILNRNSVGASTRVLILQQPTSATLWGCCSSFFSGDWPEL